MLDNSGRAAAIGDGPNVDAFSRLRTSSPVALFESQLQYNSGTTFFWNELLTAGGTATHTGATASVALTVGTSGDAVVRQSKIYHRYQPGKSSLVAMTFVMGAATTNIRRRVGYFDGSNGIFLEQTSTGVRLVRRTNVTGTPVDNAAEQADWNGDQVSGLDFSKAQIMVIDLQWLGVGRVRVGFDVAGILTYVHEFLHANVLDKVYMTTANLPIRYEITATGTIGAAATLTQICSTVMSEGGYDIVPGITRTAANGVTPIAVTTRRPILSIRPKTTFNSIVNRGQIIMENVGVFAQTNAAYWELVLGGSLTGASFASLGTNSISEVDVAASAISGGEILTAGYIGVGVGGASSIASSQVLSRIPLTLDIAGSAQQIVSVVCTSMSGTSSDAAALTFREVF